jgi:hypothetical protein
MPVRLAAVDPLVVAQPSKRYATDALQQDLPLLQHRTHTHRDMLHCSLSIQHRNIQHMPALHLKTDHQRYLLLNLLLATAANSEPCSYPHVHAHNCQPCQQGPDRQLWQSLWEEERHLVVKKNTACSNHTSALHDCTRHCHDTHAGSKKGKGSSQPLQTALTITRSHHTTLPSCWYCLH